MTVRPVRRCVFAALLILAAFSSSYSLSQDHPHYKIGVYSVRTTEETLNQWSPLAEHLQKNIPGLDFSIHPYSYSELREAIKTERIDFVLTNPLQYLEFKRDFSVERIVTLESFFGGKAVGSYGGVIFVLSDSSIRDIESLRGKRLAAVDEMSLGGWTAAWRELKERGLDPFRDASYFRFLGDNDAVVEAVLSKRFDAGIIRTGILEAMEAEGRVSLSKVRVIRPSGVAVADVPFLYSTRLYPEWPFARTKRVPEALAKKVAILLLSMTSDDPAAVAGRFSGWSVPAAYSSVEEGMKAVRSEPYYSRDREWVADMGGQEFVLAGIVLFCLLALVLYAVIVNRRLKAFRRKLEEEVRDKNTVDQELGRNEIALKNMIYDLSQAHDQLQSAQQQLLQNEKLAAIGQLAAGIAHEINNPLGFILSNIVVLKDYLEKVNDVMESYTDLRVAIAAGDQKRIEDLLAELDLKTKEYDIDFLIQDAADIYNESLDGAERIKRIVSDLKSFSRKDILVAEDANVNDIIDGVLNIVHNELKYKSILLKEYTLGLPLIKCHRQQIGQVFINILINAAQSIDKKGEIHIRTYLDQSMVRIRISDNGHGIPRELLGRIFEPFFTTKEAGAGTGLGLSICHDIIQKHDGTITVESEYGKGTIFTIGLPVK